MTLYVVKQGDTLYGIGRRYGFSPGELASLNQLSDPSDFRWASLL